MFQALAVRQYELNHLRQAQRTNRSGEDILLRMSLSRQAQLDYINDAPKLAQAQEELEKYREATLESLTVAPAPWQYAVAEKYGPDALIRTWEWRARYNVVDQDEPFGDDEMIEQQQKERHLLLGRFADGAIEQSFQLGR
jgi:hypothetical protein